MSAKLTFQDVFNNELAGSKLNFGSFTTTLSTGIGVPSSDNSTGSLYVDTATGNLYRKIANGGSNWKKIASGSTNVFLNHVRDIIVNSALTATGVQAPSLGDLVGIWGAGAWSNSGALSQTRSGMTSAGSQFAALTAGGTTAGGITNLSEFFNGSAWTTDGTLTSPKDLMAGCGSQNAAIAAGGTATVVTGVTELFNGSSWSAGNILSTSRSQMASAGKQIAAVVSGGLNGAFVIINTSQLYNGSVWSSGSNLNISKYRMAGAGSQNAALVAGGLEGTSTYSTKTELFNGSTWNIGGNLNSVRQQSVGMGSQSAALVAGGFSAIEISTTELFNGSTWAASTNINTARRLCANAGSQNAGLIAGGPASDTTELHSQTLYRKMYSGHIPDAKKIGVLLNKNTVLLQGQSITVNFYPANKYLILNRSGICSVTNETNFSTSIAFDSVLGTQPTMTYSLSTSVNLLQLIPGNIVNIVSTGPNPVAANNAGTFVVSRIVSPSSIEIQNTAGVAANPGTGTLSFISSMLAVDNISPQDIIIGKTDANGILTMPKPLIVGSLTKRLK